MFTGLVEATGCVRSIEFRGDQARLTLDLPFAAELAEGDSVAINGVCLTVIHLDAKGAGFDVLRQTLEVTSLGDLTEGSLVNLERALRVGDRLGGHFVLGHVDATGLVEAVEPIGQDHRFALRLPRHLVPYCIDKGSLAIDGISLTIASLEDDLATFWIIPHTFAHTNVHTRSAGQRVNLEVDVLAKHVAKLLGKA
ncbi:riboflavin synthase [Haloferula luteola]|uniref:Riboflavin synthase n=1 Tax=Haloferula luteola TaxID=595692 RepID=A0A840VGN6_9BACT|nr:riboflavin synthase [Haloferula luteola]MBB5352989.1 riboflavin synthase [Haloferula luteola]